MGTQTSAIVSDVNVKSTGELGTYNKTTSRYSTKENVGLETKMTRNKSKPIATCENTQDDMAKETISTGF